MLDEYTAALEQTFCGASGRCEAESRTAGGTGKRTDRTRDEQKLSLEQIGIKRELGHKQEELKDKIFVELKDVLEQYMETPEYYSSFWRSRSATPEEFAGNEDSLPFTSIRRTRQA